MPNIIFLSMIITDHYPLQFTTSLLTSPQANVHDNPISFWSLTSAWADVHDKPLIFWSLLFSWADVHKSSLRFLLLTSIWADIHDNPILGSAHCPLIELMFTVLSLSWCSWQAPLISCPSAGTQWSGAWGHSATLTGISPTAENRENHKSRVHIRIGNDDWILGK